MVQDSKKPVSQESSPQNVTVLISVPQNSTIQDNITFIV